MDFKNRVRLSNSTIYVLLFLFIFCLPLETVCSLPCSSTRLAPPRGAPDSWRAVVRRRNSFTPAKLGPNAVSSPHHAVEGALPSGRSEDSEDARAPAHPRPRAARARLLRRPPPGRLLRGGRRPSMDRRVVIIIVVVPADSSFRAGGRSERPPRRRRPFPRRRRRPRTSPRSPPPAWARNATNPPLRGNFAPVEGECEIDRLRVVRGAVPRDLSGVFLRNGPNPRARTLTRRGQVPLVRRRRHDPLDQDFAGA